MSNQAQKKLVNFVEDTIKTINANGKRCSDVLYVRTTDTQCSFKEFIQQARGFTYVNEFGCNKINTDLVIVGPDWWLSRKEYDGMESWVFNSKPQPLDTPRADLDFKCWYCKEKYNI